MNCFYFKNMIMKNFYFIMLMSIGISLFSCQNEKMLYSCDSNIETWAVENCLSINKMGRKQFLEINDISYKKAAYRVFTFENKQNIWKGKYDELSLLSWTEAEWKHISLIYSLVLSGKHISILSSKNVADDDDLLIFLYRWEDYAKTTLGWTKKQIYAICHTVEKVVSLEGDLETNTVQSVEFMERNESGANGFECMCSQKSSFCDPIDHPGPPYTVCKTPNGGSCKVVSGCGLFWQFDCDGLCLGIGV